MIKGWLWRYGWLFPWLVLIAVSYLVRGPLPIDETRYLGVAWEMWQRHDFLVPYLNGEPYSHKPPLLFWLFQAGWAVWGVNEWWPRLVAPLFALAGLYLTRIMATRLWPDRPRIAILAPWILAGCLLWAVFTPMTMFDMLLMALVMLGMLGLFRAGSGHLLTGWLVVGLAAGLGILAKGPVMLLHIAFASLLAPYWSETARQRPWAWYGLLVAAILMAAVIAFSWALPAASAGGEAYEQAILWHQTANRMVDSFAHLRPVWWYLLLLPLLLFPWLLWPAQWRAFKTLAGMHDPAVRFLLLWTIPTLIAFSLISGKQPQYLLPLFPATALLFARALADDQQAPRRRDLLLPAFFMVVIGLFLLLLPHLSLEKLPDTIDRISSLWGIAIVLLVAVLLVWKWKQLSNVIVALTLVTTMVVALLLGAVFQAAGPIYDIRPAALFLSGLQQNGAPVAHLGTYHNQYHFLGRLEQPLTTIRTSGLEKWADAHPDGYVVGYHRRLPEKEGPQPLYIQPYRGQWLSVWPARHLQRSLF
jgi:4-amino-4-deoxy-L-arabinose transferase-like glycosyltransferase